MVEPGLSVLWSCPKVPRTRKPSIRTSNVEISTKEDKLKVGTGTRRLLDEFPERSPRKVQEAMIRFYQELRPLTDHENGAALGFL